MLAHEKAITQSFKQGFNLLGCVSFIRVINIIKKWIDFEEIKEDQVMSHKLQIFAGKLIDSTDTTKRGWGQQLQSRLTVSYYFYDAIHSIRLNPC